MMINMIIELTLSKYYHLIHLILRKLSEHKDISISNYILHFFKLKNTCQKREL